MPLAWLHLGAYADLVVASGDTFKVPVSGIADLRIFRRIVEGRTVHPCDQVGWMGTDL